MMSQDKGKGDESVVRAHGALVVIYTVEENLCGTLLRVLILFVLLAPKSILFDVGEGWPLR